MIPSAVGVCLRISPVTGSDDRESESQANSSQWLLVRSRWTRSLSVIIHAWQEYKRDEKKHKQRIRKNLRQIPGNELDMLHQLVDAGQSFPSEWQQVQQLQLPQSWFDTIPEGALQAQQLLTWMRTLVHDEIQQRRAGRYRKIAKLEWTFPKGAMNTWDKGHLAPQQLLHVIRNARRELTEEARLDGECIQSLFVHEEDAEAYYAATHAVNPWTHATLFFLTDHTANQADEWPIDIAHSRETSQAKWLSISNILLFNGEKLLPTAGGKNDSWVLQLAQGTIRHLRTHYTLNHLKNRFPSADVNAAVTCCLTERIANHPQD